MKVRCECKSDHTVVWLFNQTSRLRCTAQGTNIAAAAAAAGVMCLLSILLAVQPPTEVTSAG